MKMTMKLMFAAAAVAALSGCGAATQAEPAVELGLQLSKGFCTALIQTQPERVDVVAQACRAFLAGTGTAVPAPSAAPAGEKAPTPI